MIKRFHRSSEYAFSQLTLILLLLVIHVAPSSAASAIMFLGESNWDADEYREIHLMEANGKRHRRLKTKFPPSLATYSPNGDKIVYKADGKDDLHIIDVNGRSDRFLFRLTDGADIDQIAWSPNGRFIAHSHFARRTGVFFNVVSLLDVATKRVVKSFVISQLPDPSVALNDIIGLAWSPDSRKLLVYELGFINSPGGFPVFFEKSHSVNIQTGDVTELGEYEAHDFRNNNQVLALLSGDGIGAVNVGESRGVRLVTLGANSNIEDIIAVTPNALLVQIKNLQEQYDNGATDLTALRGTSRIDDVGYDFVYINLRTKAATFVTPSNDSFRAEKSGYFAMELSRRTPASAFTTDTCWGWVVTIKGTNQSDRIMGTPFADVIHGRAGDDTIRGGGGNDVICGGRGKDRIYGQGGSNVLFGDVEMNVGDSVRTKAGRDRLFGGPDVDTIYGDNGRDLIRGGGGNDYLDGGAGNDAINGQSGEDRINGGAGTDRCTNYIRAEECES